MREKRNIYRIMVGNLERKRPLRLRWVDIIKIDLGEISLAQDKGKWVP
jgi:hypothetical protein